MKSMHWLFLYRGIQLPSGNTKIQFSFDESPSFSSHFWFPEGPNGFFWSPIGWWFPRTITIGITLKSYKSLWRSLKSPLKSHQIPLKPMEFLSNRYWYPMKSHEIPWNPIEMWSPTWSSPSSGPGPESGGGHRQLLEGEGHQHAPWQRSEWWVFLNGWRIWRCWATRQSFFVVYHNTVISCYITYFTNCLFPHLPGEDC